MLAWLKQLFSGVARCRLHTWTRNEYGTFVCAVCKHSPQVALEVPETHY